MAFTERVKRLNEDQISINHCH